MRWADVVEPAVWSSLWCRNVRVERSSNEAHHAVARERRGGLPGGVRRAAAVPVVAAVPGRQRGLRQGLEVVLVVRQHGQHPERLDGARRAAGPGRGHAAAAAQGPRAVAAARARAAAPGGLGAGRAAGAERRRHPAARQRPLLVPGPRRLHGALLGGDGGAARQRGRHRRQRPRALLGEEAADAGADVQRQPAALGAAGAAGRGRLQVLAPARRHPSLQLRAGLPSPYRPPVRSEAGMDDALPLFGDLESPPLRHL
ncbi:hypothetical protein FOCC_FOCC009367 [Frankliniella occidentalis]|nr:hypothetical protein FOCC_FOCC009367 [Frankliniella occidentalis]